MTAIDVRAGETDRSRSLARVVAASLSGTSLEWYDFFIFGSAAALVFPKLFFPQANPTTALLLSLGTYGVAFVARPLGAILFGHYGDRLGRKTILVITLLMMGIASFVIGLLPTYAEIGILAPISLVILRLIQGLAVGGEWGGAALMVNEYDPKGNHRGLLGALVQVASPIGLLLANGAFALVIAIVSPEAFLSWGWRVPFLLSAILIGIGYYVRRSVAESPLFEQIQVKDMESRTPVKEVLKDHHRQLLLGIGSRIGSDTVFYVFTFFMLIYLPLKLKIPGGTAFPAILVAAGVHAISILLFGALSDRVGRRPVLIGGALASMVWVFVFFYLVDTKSLGMIILASSVGLFCQAAMWGPLASFLPEMYPTRVRCTGASLSFQLAGIFGGATVPLVATDLITRFTTPWPVAIYVAATLLLVVGSVYAAKETVRIDLRNA